MNRFEGWDRPVRIAIKQEGVLVGGFQILSKQSRVGRIGCISKGPVLVPEAAHLSKLVAKALIETIKTLRITALVVKSPDDETELHRTLGQQGFLSNNIAHRAEATVYVDVSDGIQAIEKRMRKTTRQEINQTARAGITIRAGDDADIETFFDLMLMTCERQGEQPIPSSLEAMVAAWRTFDSTGHAKMLVAEQEGRIVAALLCILFGKRMTLWKVGWAREGSRHHPVKLLFYEALKWARTNGYPIVDFMGLPRGMAEARLENRPFEAKQKTNTYFYKLGFGGYPILLPQDLVYFRNPLLRWVHRLVLLIPCAKPFSVLHRLESKLR